MPLLLRTYAVLVAVGNGDECWCGSNNFYLYFNSTDVHDYKCYYIPYDCDNTFGIGKKECLYAAGGSPATQNPFEWGHPDNPLVARTASCPTALSATGHAQS